MSSRYEKEENGERGADQTMGPEKKENDGRGGLLSMANRTIDERQRDIETEGEAVVGCDACD